MTPQVFTLNEIADTIAKIEKRADRKRIFQQIRGAQQRGLLTSYDTHGPKGAHRFSENEVYAARVLMVMIDTGISGEVLKDLNAKMRRLRLAPFKLSLEAAIESIRSQIDNPTNWILEITLIREHKTGDFGAYASWIYGKNRFGIMDPLALDADVGDRTIELVIRIPFTRLTAPIMKALKAE